jgi:N5-(cytidine 5'-diphosphoramidyl)-L-glutamine hydrolase
VKIVAVSQRVDVYPEHNERRDALDQRLSLWVAEAGYVPMPVPNLISTAQGEDWQRLQAWLQAIRPEAVLLSGGNDIGHAPERDATERRLLAYAKDRELPVLGICRGMQMMGVWAGVALKSVEGHVRTRHILRGDFVQEVNSFHSHGLAECPQGFEVIARAEDGEIEAIRNTELYWEGWMWHPEREWPVQMADIQRLHRLFI